MSGPLQRPSSRETDPRDPRDGGAVALECGDLAAGADRAGRQRASERVRDPSVAAAGVEEAAVHVLGLAVRRPELVEQRAQRHPLQPPGRDVRRQLIGGKAPQLGGVVEKDPARERLAETADREFLEVDGGGTASPDRAKEVYENARSVPDAVGEDRVQGSGREVDVAPAIPNRARDVDAGELAAQEIGHVSRDLRVPVVETVGSAIVEMRAETPGPAHPSELGRGLEERERKARPMSVEGGSEAGRSAPQDREPGHRTTRPRAAPARRRAAGRGMP